MAELGVPALHQGASRKTGSSIQETIHIIEGGRRTVTRMNTVTNIVHLIFVVNCWGHHQPAIRKGRAYCGEGGGSGWQPSGGLGGGGRAMPSTSGRDVG